MKYLGAILCAGMLALPAHAAGVDDIGAPIFLAAIFVLACFVGYYVVWSVTPALHTPLMSVTNAISAVVVVGAIIAAAATGLSGEGTGTSSEVWTARGLGAGAVFLAAINIFGGFLVTRRMLAMYRKK
ncbi:MAG: proton-translocating transhydrogenase family protein [Pseudomonadota bacterium]